MADIADGARVRGPGFTGTVLFVDDEEDLVLIECDECSSSGVSTAHEVAIGEVEADRD